MLLHYEKSFAIIRAIKHEPEARESRAVNFPSGELTALFLFSAGDSAGGRYGIEDFEIVQENRVRSADPKRLV